MARLLSWSVRSPWPAVVVLLAALVAGVPPFLRMPPWADLTLYDVAAQNLLRGGVHYRDVFDTNLPGFVWALTAVRTIVGPSWEAIRAVDLLVVGGAAWLLAELVRRSGGGPAAQTWLLAGAAVYYPFSPEINHAQRDVWMLLPAVGATLLRVRRADAGRSLTFAGGVLEGAVWGLAVWFKPHALPVCACVWLATVRRGWLADAAGYLVGGGAVGAAGVLVLVATGTWPAFVEVFTVWNQSYFGRTWDELWFRMPLELVYFPPWSYAHPVAVLLSIWKLTRRDRAGRAVAALYLGWLIQAAILQRHIPYVHVPEILLMLAVFAVCRWPAVPLAVAWLAVLPLVADPPAPLAGRGAQPTRHGGWRTRHPATDPERMNLWADCWRPVPARDAARRMDAVALVDRFHGAATWGELAEVAGFLRGQGVRDGELICWDDSPHALYLDLGLRPGFRFQHVHQMRGNDEASRQRVDDELAAALPGARFVVGDLRFVAGTDPPGIGDWTDSGPDLLPPGLNPGYRERFPFDRPAVFRSAGGRGRYVVYAVR
jgi:hypothetical protein